MTWLLDRTYVVALAVGLLVGLLMRDVADGIAAAALVIASAALLVQRQQRQMYRRRAKRDVWP